MIIMNSENLRMNNYEISMYIDENDIYNSTLVWKLNKLTRSSMGVPLGCPTISSIAETTMNNILFQTILILANDLNQQDLLEFKQRKTINTIDLNELIE